MVKRKIVSLVVVFMMLLSTISVSAYSGGDVSQSDFIYSEDSDGITIVQYIGTATVVNIPSTIDGKTVKSVGDRAFYGNTTVKYLSVADSVITVGERAFANMSNLVEIQLSVNTEVLGEGVLSDCPNLLEFITPAKVQNIPTQLLAGDSSLTNFVMHAGVVSIGDAALQNCAKIVRLDIGANVLTVGDAVVKGCTSLKTIVNLSKVDQTVGVQFIDPTMTWVDSIYCYDSNTTFKTRIVSDGYTTKSLCENHTWINVAGDCLIDGTKTCTTCGYVSVSKAPGHSVTVDTSGFNSTVYSGEPVLVENIKYTVHCNNTVKCDKNGVVYRAKDSDLSSYNTNILGDQTINATFEGNVFPIAIKVIPQMARVKVNFRDINNNIINGATYKIYDDKVLVKESDLVEKSYTIVNDTVPDSYFISPDKTATLKLGENTVDFTLLAYKDLSAISPNNLPTTVYSNSSLDLTNATLSLIFNDGSKREVPLLSQYISGFDSTIPGRKNITIQAFNKTLTYGIDVLEKVDSVSIVENSGFKDIYKKGTDLYYSGLSLDVKSGSSVKRIPVTTDMVSGYSKDKLGKQTITITYGGKSDTLTVEVTDTGERGINISYSSTYDDKWTDSPVKLEVSATDNSDYIILPSGGRVYDDSLTFYVNKNGSYKFKSEEGSERTVSFTKIDTDSPKFTVSGDTTNGKLIINATDNASGIDKIYYSGDGRATYNESKLEVTPRVGSNYISIMDKAGNETRVSVTTKQVSAGGSSQTEVTIFGYIKDWTKSTDNLLIFAKNTVDGILDVKLEKADNGSTTYNTQNSGSKKTYGYSSIALDDSYSCKYTVITSKGTYSEDLSKNDYDNGSSDIKLGLKSRSGENYTVRYVVRDKQSGIKTIILPTGRLVEFSKPGTSSKDDNFVINGKGLFEVQVQDYCGNWTTANIDLTTDSKVQEESFYKDDTITSSEEPAVEVKYVPIKVGFSVKNTARYFGYINGYPDNTFKPNASTSRIEFCSIINSMLDTGNVSSSYNKVFKDIKKEHEWGATAIYTLKEKGIISGVASNEFDPDRPITREEVVSILGKLLDLSNFNTDKSFNDTQSSYANNEISKLASAGVINGYGDNMFKPSNEITRAEAVTMLNKLFSVKRNSYKNFQDVKQSDWYYKEVTAASK